MKKISNVEVKLINLNATDVIATSDPAFGVAYTSGNYEARIGGRDYYDDDEEW